MANSKHDLGGKMKVNVFFLFREVWTYNRQATPAFQIKGPRSEAWLSITQGLEL